MTRRDHEARRGRDGARDDQAGRPAREENAMTRTAKARMTEAELAALADALAAAPDAEPGAGALENAARAEAAAAALDEALAELAAASPPPLPPALLARMERDAAEALAASRDAPGPTSTPALARPARPAAASRAPRLAGGARRRAGRLTRIGAPAAFAASMAMGVALGYSGDNPLARGFALLTTGYSYESAFLQAEFLPGADLPTLEETR